MANKEQCLQEVKKFLVEHDKNYWSSFQMAEFLKWSTQQIAWALRLLEVEEKAIRRYEKHPNCGHKITYKIRKD